MRDLAIYDALSDTKGGKGSVQRNRIVLAKLGWSGPQRELKGTKA